jgi:signal peptidase I
MKKERPKIEKLREWVKDAIVALLIVLVVTTFFWQNKRVVGNSMAPTLENNQMVIMNKWIYTVSNPKKGDIIGFKLPNQEENIVKRVIGVEGDLISYEEGFLCVNGEPFYIAPYPHNQRGDIEYPFVVPESAYFVVGDNVNHSIDSRYKSVGCIVKKDIIGRIDIRVWPFWHNPLLKNRL